MNYRDEQQPSNIVGAKEKPRLIQQLETLNKTLSTCHESAGALEHIADRILGPVPAGTTSKATASPSQDTIERKLQDAIDYADALSARLRDSTQRLSSAV